MNTFSKLTCIILTLFIFCTAGCGNDKNNAGSEKVFRYGTTAYGPAMQNAGTNPHDSYCGWSTVRYGIGETLFRLTDDRQIEPWLAESFTFTDDVTAQIKIRDDLTFSNGKKVTADAVKTCFADLLAQHDRAAYDLKIASMDSDGQVLTLHLKEPVPALVNYLTDPYSAVIDMDAGTDNRICVGTGPYKAVSVTDKEVVLEKNGAYWGTEKPKLDKIIVTSVPDGAALSAALQSGEFDAAQGLPYTVLPTYRKNADYTLSTAQTSRVYEAAMNFRSPALQDPFVRKAVAGAIDKNQFAQVLLNGNGRPALGPYPDPEAAEETASPEADSITAGRKLLEQAGYTETDSDGYVLKNGRRLRLRWLTYPSRQELPVLAEYAQSRLKDMGIDVVINSTDAYKDFLKRDDFDIYANAIVTVPTGDREYYISSCLVDKGPYNAGHYENAEIDALADELHGTFGAAARNDLAARIVRLALEDNAYVYVAFLNMTLVMKSTVTGFQAHGTDFYEITPALDIHSI